MPRASRKNKADGLGRLYSKGEANKITDAILHPHFKNNPETIILDSLTHALIERDPSTSVKKFVRYNAPIIISELTKGLSGRSPSFKSSKHHKRFR